MTRWLYLASAAAQASPPMPEPMTMASQIFSADAMSGLLQGIIAMFNGNAFLMVMLC
jgi:hypothetical protein